MYARLSHYRQSLSSITKLPSRPKAWDEILLTPFLPQTSKHAWDRNPSVMWCVDMHSRSWLKLAWWPELSCCRVEWEFWTSSNDGCGNSCDIQLRFKKEFGETAKKLEMVCHDHSLCNNFLSCLIIKNTCLIIKNTAASHGKAGKL